jgi:hypothetical protein
VIVWLWDAPGPARTTRGVTGSQTRARQAAEALITGGQAHAIDTPAGPRKCIQADISRGPDRKPMVAIFGGIPLKRQKNAVIPDRNPAYSHPGNARWSGDCWQENASYADRPPRPLWSALPVMRKSTKQMTAFHGSHQRAGCGESRTSGSGGGRRKKDQPKAGTSSGGPPHAPRPAIAPAPDDPAPPATPSPPAGALRSLLKDGTLVPGPSPDSRLRYRGTSTCWFAVRGG